MIFSANKFSICKWKSDKKCFNEHILKPCRYEKEIWYMSERSTTSCCCSLLYSVQKSQSFVNTILIHCFDCCQYQQLKIVNVDTNVW